jgi:signal transduction histidine kinase/CheY-like chemotaxis protein
MVTLGSVNDFAEQQLQVLTKHVGFRRVLLVSGGVMGILVLAAVAMRHVSRWSLLACLAAQVVVLVAYSVPPRGIGRALWHFMLSRLSSSRLFARCEVGGTTSQLRLVVLRFGVAEANLALSLVFFPALPLLERVVQTTVLVSAAFFAVPAAGGYRPIMYAISIPLFVLAILWATVPLPDAASVSLADPAVWGTELGLLLGWLMMYVATEATRRVVMDSFIVRSERAQLVRALSISLEQSEAANRAKTRFLASASHDLRQPIHSVSLFAAALEMRPLDPRSREIARCINHSLQDLSVELNALLDISKLDAGTVRPELTSIEMQPLLQRLRDAFVVSADIKGLALSFECPADAWICTDRSLLERIVRNLLENAIKYTAAGGIAIQVQPTPSSYLLSIADTGCGIPEAERERVFEEFYQVDNAARDRRCGLGLGLSIVKRLAELLGLALKMHSHAGQGTTFSLDLPRAARALVSAKPADERWLTQPPHARVLVVDDEETVLGAMRALLEEMSCKVISAASTDAALQAIASESPDLLIADFRLACPNGGLGTIAAVRARLPGLPALLITGDTAPDRLREAHAANIPVLHKPVCAEVLQQAMAQLLIEV